MTRNERIAFVQNEARVMVECYIADSKIRDDKVKEALLLLCLNLPYKFIADSTGLGVSYLRKIKSTHKSIVRQLQVQTQNLYQQHGVI